jgi:hypothetical protein
VSVACSWAARCGTGPRGWAVWQRRAGWCVAHGGAGLGGTGPQATHARTVEVGQLSPSPSLFLCSSSSLFPLLFTDLETAGPSPAMAGLDLATADPNTVAESLELDAAA